MASLHVSSEELSCPVCCDIFKSPVLLSCAHSICKECIQKFWRTTKAQECPVCRRRSSKLEPTVNLALKSLCESFLKERNESRSSGSEEICALHSEKLKLFCLEDKQPACVVCRDSQKHINHTFRPISEVGPSYTVSSSILYPSITSKESHLQCWSSQKNMTSSHQFLNKIGETLKKSFLIEDGNPARYRLQKNADNLEQPEPYRKITFGKRDIQKPHKTILMVGETGTGKTTLINAMTNYMLGVQRKDKVWFEITDDQSDQKSVYSQTSCITVYGLYLQENPIDLTIIDTPGYGDTRGISLEKKITKSLHSLSKSEEGIHEIDAVCLVIKATQNRLSDRQTYIFDAVQSLFGRDIAENIILLFTHSTGARPKNILMAVQEAKIKCAVNDKHQPVYFLFDNCQSDAADEDDEDEEDREQRLAQSWKQSFKGMMQLFKFLDTIQPKSLNMTQDVLQKRNQLEANINNLQSRVEITELKQNELKQTQEALEKNKEHANFKYEADMAYRELVDIDTSVAKAAMCCTVCEENCHYPGCWWTSDLSWCEVMKNNHCTVCTNKCHYSKHVKQSKIYVTKIKKIKRTFEDLKKTYNGKIQDSKCVVNKLEEELQELQREKIKLVNEAFHCVESLEKIALNADSVLTLQHIDFLIEKMMEINEPEKAEALKNIKKRAGEEKQGAMGYIKRFFKK